MIFYRHGEIDNIVLVHRRQLLLDMFAVRNPLGVEMCALGSSD